MPYPKFPASCLLDSNPLRIISLLCLPITTRNSRFSWTWSVSVLLWLLHPFSMLVSLHKKLRRKSHFLI